METTGHLVISFLARLLFTMIPGFLLLTTWFAILWACRSPLALRLESAFRQQPFARSLLMIVGAAFVLTLLLWAIPTAALLAFYLYRFNHQSLHHP
ncbi:MAG: hypothetical protein WDO13_11335 [Verrucomicrobiota bacterium]